MKKEIRKKIERSLERGLEKGAGVFKRILALFLCLCIISAGDLGIGNVSLALASGGQRAQESSELCSTGWRSIQESSELCSTGRQSVQTSSELCSAGLEKASAYKEINLKSAAQENIDLNRLDGSGNAFVYHSFNETKTFTVGETYAFLNGIYGPEAAVSSLGAGAILKATDTENESSKYIKGKYGDSAKVTVYVDVVTKGSDFDYCVVGGLYTVLNSGTPTEYRYFCGYGGAQNCGPYYAYNYTKESLGFNDVSASLKTIENQGSEKPEDYTVTVTYNGGQSKTLDPGSYTVSVPDKTSDRVTFVISDSEGNSITANFQCPLVIRYDGNAEGVTNVPSIQPMWRGVGADISYQVPERTGYAFEKWKDADTETAYTAGQSITPAKSLHLLAQWRDTKAPEVGYTPIQVMTGTSEADVINAVKAALTITDNEPVSECTVEVTLSSSNFTSTAGNKNVTVVVKDKAGNSTTKECLVNVASYVDISKPVFTDSTQNLTSTLNNPGMDEITESGFVWGVMNAPSLTVNNGKAVTTTVASKVGDKISVTADNLQKGVTYYARAYITAGDVTYYSDETTFGLGLPDYGTFTIKNNGNNTFTVTRSGKGEGVQTVYYRTVNGSAVGGTHFTHQADVLTFAEGQTERTITINENPVNTAYSSASINKPATAYTNADRTYSVEIYRVKGGGSLGSTTSATRKMSMNDSYKINRTLYSSTGQDAKAKATWDRRGSSEYVVVDGGNGETNGDNDGINLYNGRTNLDGHKHDPYYLPRFHQKISLSTYERAYFTGGSAASSDGWGYRYVMRTKVIEGFWGHMWVGNAPAPGQEDKKSSLKSGDSSGKGALDTDNQKWAGCFDSDVSGFSDGTKDVIMPGTTADGLESVKEKGTFRNVDGKRYVLFGIDETAYMHFAACGNNEDAYKINSITEYVCLIDTKEPQLVAVAPMAGGVYKVGDSFTVSLIFDEIVDSTNSGSSNLSNIKLNTTWGEAKYAGGADTNVLYFTGTVVSNATSPLKVNSFTNADKIKDMCNCTTSTATVSKGGDTEATVDISAPNFTVAQKSISNGTGTATITVNDDKNKTTGMSYAWSDSSTAPTSGWVELTAAELSAAKESGGLSLSIRKEPGSGSSNGKWYLHVKGIYDTTGETAYKNACVDFGTKDSPSSGSTKPTLAVTVDNSNWATSRKITINAVGAETLKYRESKYSESGSTAWKPLGASDTSVTVYENGYYTFLLTAGDTTITKTVKVENIDKDMPTAFIGELVEEGTVESPKESVYTKLTLPVSYADAQSGVGKVEYAWTNSANEPALGSNEWKTLYTNGTQSGAGTQQPLTSGEAKISYEATENKPTIKYLHIKVTDNVGYTHTACSAAYTMISQSAVDSHTPKITITGNPDKWTNDMATLKWDLTDYENKKYEVILPDGRSAKEGAASGEVWAMQNGTYTVTVRDLDYGGENTASITVDKLDFTAPSVAVSKPSENWTTDAQTITLSAEDTGSGVGEIWYKLVPADEVNSDGPADEASSDGPADEAGSDGPADEAGSDGTADEAGSDGPADEANPNVSGKEITEDGMTQLDTISSTNNGVTTVKGNITVKDNGEWYIYYKVYDNTGDNTIPREANKTKGFSEPVKVDAGEPKLALEYESKGVPESTGLSVLLSAEYGISGGNVKVQHNGKEEEIAALAAAPSPGSSGGKIEKNAEYTVKEKGNYTFTIKTGNGKTSSAALDVYKAEFYPCSDSENTAKPVQLVAAGGTLTEPEKPERSGYTFMGWYTSQTGGDEWNFETNTVSGTNTASQSLSLYARWEDKTAPDAPVLAEGESLPESWTNTQNTIPLMLKDGVGVTKLWVSVDGGEYKEVSGFPGGSAESAEYRYGFTGVLEGEHTYSFKAEDKAGNQSKESIEFKIKLDTAKPKLAITGYENKTKDVEQWVVGKENLIIHVSVTDEESGSEDGSIEVSGSEGSSGSSADSVIDGSGNAASSSADSSIADSGNAASSGADSVIDGSGNAASSSADSSIKVSGVEKISYTMTPVDGDGCEYAEGTRTRTANVTGGRAEIKISDSFKGKIKICCQDGAGNEADSVMAGGENGGVIVEASAPSILVMADRGTSDIGWVSPGGVAFSSEYYDSTPNLSVTVKDDTDNGISAGIAHICVKMGDATEEAISIDCQGIEKEKVFNIPADMINDLIKAKEETKDLKAAGDSAKILIETTDNAGNASQREVTVKVRRMETAVQSQGSKVNEGELRTAVIKEAGLPKTEIDSLSTEAAVSLLDRDEAEAVSKGATAVIYLKLMDAKNTATEDERSEITKAAGNIGTPKIGAWLDLSLYKQIVSQPAVKIEDASGTALETVSGTAFDELLFGQIASRPAVKIEDTSGTAVEVAVEIPSYLLPKESNKVRTYTIIRCHGGRAEPLATEQKDGVLKFKTDKFSVYAIAYKETTISNPHEPSSGSSSSPQKIPTPSGAAVTPGAVIDIPSGESIEAPSEQELMKNGLLINEGLKAGQRGRKIIVEWGGVDGADGYDVYVQYCGRKFTLKSINPVKGNDVTRIVVKKVNGKKLNLKKNYKLYVIAYKLSDGKKITLGKSITAHIVGRKNNKFTNVKEVVLKEDTYSLSIGETADIEAVTVLVSPDKKQLSDRHAKEFRYATGNKEVAVVSKKGRIRAVGKGKCTIYVYARNGYAKKVKVTVGTPADFF